MNTPVCSAYVMTNHPVSLRILHAILEVCVFAQFRAGRERTYPCRRTYPEHMDVSALPSMQPSSCHHQHVVICRGHHSCRHHWHCAPQAFICSAMCSAPAWPCLMLHSDEVRSGWNVLLFSERIRHRTATVTPGTAPMWSDPICSRARQMYGDPQSGLHVVLYLRK